MSGEIDLEKVRREEIRWRLLKALDAGRPHSVTEALLLAVLDDVHLTVTELELRRELETVLHDIGVTLAVLPINLPSQPEKPATPEPAEEEQKSELPFSGTLDRLKGIFRQE